MHNFYMFVATGAYSGLAKKAPGTFGTMAAIPIVLLTGGWSLIFKFLVFMALFILGLAASEYYEIHTGQKDPGAVVIDEIAAYYLVMMFFDVTFVNVIGAFIFFRFFDIVKPYPIKKYEHIKGGVGIMVDDILAALYAIICMIILVRFYG